MYIKSIKVMIRLRKDKIALVIIVKVKREIIHNLWCKIIARHTHSIKNRIKFSSY